MLKKFIGCIVVAVLEVVVRMCGNLWSVADWIDGSKHDPNWFAWAGEDVHRAAEKIAVWSGIKEITDHDRASQILAEWTGDQVADAFGYFSSVWANTLLPDYIKKPMGTSGSGMTDMMYEVLFDANLAYEDRMALATHIRQQVLEAIRKLLTDHGIMMSMAKASEELAYAEVYGNGMFSIEAMELIERIAMYYGWLKAAGDLHSIDAFLTSGDVDELTGVHVWCPGHGYARVNKSVKYGGDFCVECADQDMYDTFGYDPEDEEANAMGAYEYAYGHDEYSAGNVDDESQYVPRA